ncbi:hypothetical protein RWH43_08885 [Microbacterium sp. KSW2-21]|uniref:O-antigen/teichoic acid export membrane protein n=1 Tax=Microbacterium algihabitans TaxID=3075992 RepID=A0ABU3RVF0_9MICO|nr:hypothetical protein [Microbacterium sp. KSW2-21]MDU0326867.1 hypothetical protein [Microbacterium sp. KSW2-21]
MAAGVAAGAYTQLVSIILQLVTVPIFLWRWSLEEYGIWLVISAAQTYFALSEFGVISAAGSRMTVLYGRAAFTGANRVFGAAVSFVTVTFLALVVLSPIVTIAAQGLGLPLDFSLAAGLLVVSVAMAQVGGLSFVVYQASGRNHRGVASIANTRVAEWLGGIVGLLLTNSPIFVALGMLLGRTIATALVLRDSLKGQSVFSIRLVRWRYVRLHLTQSFANFSITLASSLSIQGVTILVGVFYGASDVAIFNIYRTAARIVVQATAIVSHAAWPEFAALHGSGSVDRMKAFYKRIQKTSLGLSTVACVALICGFPLLLLLWTHNTVPLNWGLVLAVSSYAMLASCWHVPRVLLTAVGDNRGVSRAAVVAALVVVASATLLGAARAEIWTQAVGMAVGEAIAAIVTIRLAGRWLARR